MKVFISSVRKGLEKERDSLRGLIAAAGHTPVMFEDFSAQSTPSREACLAALGSADVYLLLLGPNYGHVFPETEQSATHDEWVHAQHLGKSRLVFRKDGVRFDPQQQAFSRIVEAYPTGVFRDSFSDSADLQVKVVRALRELESRPSPLEFRKLTRTPAPTWITEANGAHPFGASQESLLELHVLPLDHPGYSAREMSELSDSLVNRIRRAEYFESGKGLDLYHAREYATVSVGSDQRRAWDDPRSGEIREVRLYKTGQISTRATLPTDGMGPILDRELLPKQFSEMLRLTGALGLFQEGHVVVAVGLPSSASLCVDTFDPHRSRMRAQPVGLGRSADIYRTEPDESVSLAALENGADEVGKVLSRALFDQLSA